MGQKATPTSIKLLRGADKRNPQRFRDIDREPVPVSGIGEAPKVWISRHRDIWDELVGISPPGVLGDTDRPLMEITVKLLDGFRTDPDYPAAKLDKLIKCLSEMGFTPASRSKVKVPKKSEVNKYAGR